MSYKVELWTDGSGTMQGPMGWAYVLVAIDSGTGEIVKQQEGSGGALEGTNNRAELTAIIEGLKAMTKPAVVTVKSDSEYAINGMKKGWVDNWRRNGWRSTGQGRKKPEDHKEVAYVQCSVCGWIAQDSIDPRRICYRHDPAELMTAAPDWRMVSNRDLWSELAWLVEKFHTWVGWEWVRGHADIPLNERCDELAGAERRKLIEAIRDGELQATPPYELRSGSTLF